MPAKYKNGFHRSSFDRDDLTLSVTTERVQEILELVNTWMQKKSATLQKLQSLVGNFISSCVHGS